MAMFLLCAGAFAADSQTGEDPELLLQRIRTKMADHLSQLRNYTCHVVIDRLIRRASTSRFEHRDRVELEAAFVGDKELFSRPGETSFQEQPISRMVPAGMISNNAFGSHDDIVFSGDTAEFKFRGRCKKDGHDAFRYEFRVPEEKSQFLVKHDSAEAIVGYKGSVWVDAETLDVVRLDWKTENIPPSVGISSIEKSMRYKVLRIGHSDFLLPRDSEIAAFDPRGNYSLNMVSLEGCREFTGDSVVNYETPANDSPDVTKRPER